MIQEKVLSGLMLSLACPVGLIVLAGLRYCDGEASPVSTYVAATDDVFGSN